MNNLGAIITTVTLVIAGVYLLSLGGAVHEFFLRLFHLPEWHEAPPIVGIILRGMFLIAFVVILRFIILGVRRDE